MTIKSDEVIIVEVEEDLWPHKHKLWNIGNKILHKPAWMYLSDNKIKCGEEWATYFLVNEIGQKVKKFATNCKITFKDSDKTETVLDEVFEDVEKSENNEDKEADEEVDDFIENLLGQNASDKLKTVKLNEEIYTIAWKQMASSVRSYALNKSKILIWEYTEIKGLKNRDYYNGLVAGIFTDFSNKVKINKFQNEFAQNLSAISFSLSSYQDENLNIDTRDFFRKKFVNDLKKLQVSYTKIQKKEDKIMNFFF